MKKVLVVDDETAITDGLMALFELEKIDVAGAYDRESAEKMIGADFYPVILADLRLRTEADGLQLLETIRRVSPRSRVATLTAFATPEVEAKLLALGSTVVLRKPLEFDVIVEIVGEILAEIELEAAAQVQRTGEPLDVAQLYADSRKILFSIPQRRFGFSAEETEELVQEAWCLFMQKMEGVSMPRPWLAGTISNLCKQKIHAKTRSRALELEVGEETEELQSGATEMSETTLIVRQGLSRLEARERQLCVLIGMEGWSYEEVSEELGLPIGSVGPLYIRAKKKLRNAIEVVQ